MKFILQTNILSYLKNCIMQNKKAIYVLCVGAFIFFLAFSSLSGMQGDKKTPMPTTPVKLTYIITGQLYPLWDVKEAYVMIDRLIKTIDANQGLFCFSGDWVESSAYKTVVCLNDETGEILWRNQGGQSALAITPTGVVVGYQSPGTIRKFDLHTGDLLWRKVLGGTGTTYLYIENNQIQVLTNPDYLWILDNEGNIITQFGGKHYLFSSPSHTYLLQDGYLKAFMTGTEDLKWEYFDDNIVQAPLFTDEKIFIRDNEKLGKVNAIDRKTGALLWTSDPVWSNLAYSPEKNLVYALQIDGNLIAIDAANGNKSTVVQFSPEIPKPLDSSGNQLAYDPIKHVLIVSIGGSHQFFAFQEK
jgi:hypothetical protein